MSRAPLRCADLSCAVTPIPFTAKDESDAARDSVRHALCDGRGLLLWAAVLRTVWMWSVRAMLRATICRASILSAVPAIPTVLPTARHFTLRLCAPRLVTANLLQRPVGQIRSLSSARGATRPGPANAQYSVFPAAALSWWSDSRTSGRPVDRQPLLRANQQSSLQSRLRRPAISAKSTAIIGEFL
jgi:hypothetical protein